MPHSRKLPAVLASGALALTASSGARAHHSFAMFDSTQCKAIAGTVRNFQWTFPHSWIWLNVPGRNGTVQVWGFEGEPPSDLSRQGWKKNTLQKGDKVNLHYNPLRDGRMGGAFSSALLPDGTLLMAIRGKGDACAEIVKPAAR
ncbi:MAG TPA: DUF6152 family protein [Steroidobacteraceae bacterium]|nr:DUF6152 family protein [Steroidobacteraceae bacterium]